jgi:Mlc titration factor MtfA (ptsG expression regulator)
LRTIGLLLLAGAFILALVIGRPAFRKRRRRRLKAKSFPPDWQRILERNVPLYNLLPDSLKQELHAHINVFLTEKNFEGCGGLELTDEVKVTIAAQACVLLLNRKTDYYPRLYSVLVYPAAYVAKRASGSGTAHGDEEKEVRLGESWRIGSVVLAWDGVKHGAMDPEDGHNLVLHEFAHQLDQEDGQADGAPILEQRSSYVTWARILSKEYEELQRNVRNRHKTVMDWYGATGPAEFFAVATEAFFEKPKLMRQKHPELYEELKSYYKLDPSEWL